MGRNAGPVGSGLIPPAVSKIDDDEEELGVEDQGDDDDLEDDDLDPDGGQGDGDEGEDRFAEALRKAEENMQRRFDRAVTKIQKRLEERYAGAGSAADDDEEDDGEEEEAPPKGRAPQRQVSRRRQGSDVTTIRLMARETVADEMDGAGREERKSVKSVLDAVLPLIDWSRVEDEAEVVEELVGKLKGVTEDLVKTGADRKVAQLRRSGRLPQRPGQPGSVQGSSGTGLGQKMQKGAAVAAERFPNGQRRLGR